MLGVVKDFVPLIARMSFKVGIRLTMQLQVATYFTGCNVRGMSFVRGPTTARFIVRRWRMSRRTHNATDYRMIAA